MHMTTTKEKKTNDLTINKKVWILPWSIVFAALIISTSLVYYVSASKQNTPPSGKTTQISKSETTDIVSAELSQELIIPAEGVVLSFTWNDLGKQMVQSGVIDQDKFEALYTQRGGLPADMQAMLSGESNEPVRITSENAPVILNLAWALGLGNKNPILEQGPMVDERYGGAGNFASTGGWTLAKGNAMDHYSKHTLITLNREQQVMVERVSQGIFRPCCGNSTHFPDCNHGMAMLGLLELMASQGVSEDEMFNAALAINSYWFPSTYLTIAKLYEKNSVS